MPSTIDELTIGSTAAGIFDAKPGMISAATALAMASPITMVRRASSMREVIACRPLMRTKHAENSSEAPITGRGIRMSVPVTDGRNASTSRNPPTANPITRLLTAVATCRPMLAVDGVTPSEPTRPAKMFPSPLAKVPRLIEPISGRTHPASLSRWQAVMSPIPLRVKASAAMANGGIISGAKDQPG